MYIEACRCEHRKTGIQAITNKPISITTTTFVLFDICRMVNSNTLWKYFGSMTSSLAVPWILFYGDLPKLTTYAQNGYDTILVFITLWKTATEFVTQFTVDNLVVTLTIFGDCMLMALYVTEFFKDVPSFPPARYSESVCRNVSS